MKQRTLEKKRGKIGEKDQKYFVQINFLKT